MGLALEERVDAPPEDWTPLALAASLQVCLAAPNLLIQEQSLGIHYNESADPYDYLVDTCVFSYRDGWVARTGRLWRLRAVGEVADFCCR
ncbi:hypothetical protein [Micromonospora sp. NPDC005324]|uniref:hypothetical protein n=1 Tax=Micromonospora sp. NPDC005324 TaxID=3157033 RepID=UPI0033B6A582